MIIVMKNTATESDINKIKDMLDKVGVKTHISQGEFATVIGVLGDKDKIKSMNIEMYSGVHKCIPIMHSYKLASKEMAPNGRVVKVGELEIGGKDLAMIAGPCSVESEEQIFETACGVKNAGAKFLRGGAFKPRTSPYAFQGLEEEGLKLLRSAGDKFGLKVVSEIISENQIDMLGKYCDVLQIGARNMQNFRLLKAVGRAKIPVLLKRGIASTIEEWLDASEYIMSEGNYSVILCERGIRTFETSTRNTLDISSVPVVKKKSCLPIIVDPSHAAGNSDYIESLCLAAVAGGADGLIVEVHNNPMVALSDSKQQIPPEKYEQIINKVSKIAQVMGRRI